MKLHLVTFVDTNGMRYYIMSIQSFTDAETKALFDGVRVRRFIHFESVAMRKLAMMNQAARLDDLRIPPGNRLEALSGDREGQYSIRINDQFRICFRWTSAGPIDVEILDYH